MAILTMSQIYRTIAASTKTVSQAMAIAGVVTLAIVIYTGFVIVSFFKFLLESSSKTFVNLSATAASGYASVVQMDKLDQSCRLRIRRLVRERAPRPQIRLL
jgi:hypothetical protein